MIRFGSDGLRLAFGTLTAVRVPAPTSLQPPIPGRAMALAPLTGLVPGFGGAIAAWLAIQAGLGSAVAAVCVLGVWALATRGLHLDGLGDTADGLAASYQRERALEVMRRSDTGPSGLAAVVLVLLLQAAALQQSLAAALVVNGPGAAGQARAVLVVVAAAVAARLATPLACTRGIPAARPEGLGATVAGSVSVPLLALVMLSAAAGVSLAAVGAGLSWWHGPLAILAVLAITALLTRRAVRRFGGITGDVLGAAVELSSAAALLVLAAREFT